MVFFHLGKIVFLKFCVLIFNSFIYCSYSRWLRNICIWVIKHTVRVSFGFIYIYIYLNKNIYVITIGFIWFFLNYMCYSYLPCYPLQGQLCRISPEPRANFVLTRNRCLAWARIWPTRSENSTTYVSVETLNTFPPTIDNLHLPPASKTSYTEIELSNKSNDIYIEQNQTKTPKRNWSEASWASRL